jgi:hypothetical protein
VQTKAFAYLKKYFLQLEDAVLLMTLRSLFMTRSFNLLGSVRLHESLPTVLVHGSVCGVQHMANSAITYLTTGGLYYKEGRTSKNIVKQLIHNADGQLLHNPFVTSAKHLLLDRGYFKRDLFESGDDVTGTGSKSSRNAFTLEPPSNERCTQAHVSKEGANAAYFVAKKSYHRGATEYSSRSKFTVIEVGGTSGILMCKHNFDSLVPDRSFRHQALHHAAVTGLEHV